MVKSLFLQILCVPDDASEFLERRFNANGEVFYVRRNRELMTIEVIKTKIDERAHLVFDPQELSQAMTTAAAVYNRDQQRAASRLMRERYSSGMGK
jgi:hypothetical protein